MMARAGSIYPQVDPGASGLAHRAFVRCDSAEPVNSALRLAARRRARLLVLPEGRTQGVAFPGVLRRAAALGLGEHPVGSFTVWGVPALSGEVSEVEVRRRLLKGAPAVLVRERGETVGVIEPSGLGRPAPSPSLLSRLERQITAPVIEFLRAAGTLGASLGIPVFLVGGFVRDLMLERQSLDLDLVAEGDGTLLARRLARRIKGRLSLYSSFGTAMLRGGPAGVVDVATARRERYPAPGALPVVSRASILEDLRRRDFTVNAMAIALAPSSFGALLDPVGGLNDLSRRRVRVLHPLSFIEDPTRLFRAIRYAVRLGFGLDRNSRRWLRVALQTGPYPALSGQRLMAELKLIAREPRPAETLIALGRLGAFRLLEPSYRFAPIAALRLRDSAELVRWAAERRLAIADLSLQLLALVSHLDDGRAERIFRRLALSGEPLSRLMRARADGPTLMERLARAEAPSRRARWLRGQPPETLGWTWLLSSPAARRQIEWFLAEAAGVRPGLGGEDLVALGAPRGPMVGALLDRLRDARLDRGALTRAEEVALVRAWLNH